MSEQEKNRRIKDLLYLYKVIGYLITNEIEEGVMRNRPSSNEDIKDHIIYQLNEILR